MNFVAAVIIIIHITNPRLLDRVEFYPKRRNAQICVNAFENTIKLLSGARPPQKPRTTNVVRRGAFAKMVFVRSLYNKCFL